MEPEQSEMKEYVYHANVKARPMTRGDYNEYRGWDLPADEDPADSGFLIEWEDGSESWFPEKLFLSGVS